MRCTLIPQELQNLHVELHTEDSCQFDHSRDLDGCLVDQVVVLDVPRYQDIQIVVPITDTLEKIFQDSYGNSIVRLFQSIEGFHSSYSETGFLQGRFVDLDGNVLMHKVIMSDILVREIIYRWIVQREVCVLAVAKSVHIQDLIDEIHDVLPGQWYLDIGDSYSSYKVPREPDEYRSEHNYGVLSIIDGLSMHIKID